MKRVQPLDSPFGAAFNAARLSEAADIYRAMIDADATVVLTMAGALTPTGLGGAIISLIKQGLVDLIISTGANLYHDMHFALDLPLYKGSPFADDKKLQRDHVVRIYDVFIPFDTLFETDRYIQKHITLEGCVSSAELHYHLGKTLLENAPKPNLSILAMATKYEIPIYCPSPGDSSIGMNIAYLRAHGKNIITDVEKDVLETAALIHKSDESGAIILGGGAPKNFFMQTQPMLSQIFTLPERGHDYFIQITADAPHWGGLSGATSNEAISWNKIVPESTTHVTIYGDCTVFAPLLFSKVADCMRKPKRLYAKREKSLKELLDEAVS